MVTTCLSFSGLSKFRVESEVNRANWIHLKLKVPLFLAPSKSVILLRTLFLINDNFLTDL